MDFGAIKASVSMTINNGPIETLWIFVSVFYFFRFFFFMPDIGLKYILIIFILKHWSLNECNYLKLAFLCSISTIQCAFDLVYLVFQLINIGSKLVTFFNLFFLHISLPSHKFSAFLRYLTFIYHLISFF